MNMNLYYNCKDMYESIKKRFFTRYSVIFVPDPLETGEVKFPDEFARKVSYLRDQERVNQSKLEESVND